MPKWALPIQIVSLALVGAAFVWPGSSWLLVLAAAGLIGSVLASVHHAEGGRAPRRRALRHADPRRGGDRHRGRAEHSTLSLVLAAFTSSGAGAAFESTHAAPPSDTRAWASSACCSSRWSR